MAVRCHRCGKLSPDRSQRCECGYDFVTGEIGPAYEPLASERAAAAKNVSRGAALLACSLPFLVLLLALAYVFGSFELGLVGVAGATAAFTAGTASLITGLQARRKLRAAAAPPQLPPARILE